MRRGARRHAPGLAALGALAVAAGCTQPAEAAGESAASAACGACHAEQLAEWRESPHARGTRSPVFRALRAEAERSWGASAAARCTSCHAPPHAGDDAAITCVSCHAAVGNRGEHDGLLVVDLEGGLAASATPPSSAPHALRDGALLRASALCATCHELGGPRLFVETTGSEHAGSWAGATGVECLDCHAPRVERARADGTRVTGIDHRFVGLDHAWDGDAEARAAQDRRATALLATALELELVRLDASRVEVRVTNVGAGHAVPTGVGFLRDVWIDVELVGTDGAPAVQDRVLTLGDRPRQRGRDVPLLTGADEVVRGSLAAGEEARVVVATPAGGRAVAVLRARAVRGEVLEALGLSERAGELATLELARTTPE